MSQQLCELGAEKTEKTDKKAQTEKTDKTAMLSRCEQGRSKCAALQARADEICNPGVSAPRP